MRQNPHFLLTAYRGYDISIHSATKYLNGHSDHKGVLPEELKKLGISDQLIRLSVGIEATADLMDDLEQALGT